MLLMLKPAHMPTLDGTLYLVYCYEWLQHWTGTIEKIGLKPGLSGTAGTLSSSSIRNYNKCIKVVLLSAIVPVARSFLLV